MVFIVNARLKYQMGDLKRYNNYNAPVTMSSIGRIHDNLLITAWYAGSFGLALTAVRLRVSRSAAAFLLLIVSGVTLGFMLYGLFSRAYIR